LAAADQALLRPDLQLQVKDHIGTRSVPIGAGEVDLRGYIEALHAIGYEGALAVELEVEDPENLPRYVAEPIRTCAT